MAELRDLKIEGMGSCYGGTYNKVSVEGITSIKDDLKCSMFYSGGMCRASGSIEADEIHTEGTFKSSRNIKAKKIHVEGVLSGDAVINADVLKLEGVVKCKELSADSINIDGVCRAVNIFGEKIDINSTYRGSLGTKIFNKKFDLSKVKLIECTEINANLLEVEIIRAQKVIIGKHCKVDVVEYSIFAEIHPEARVGTLTKI